MRAACPDVNELARCEPCGGKNAGTFKSKHSNEFYQIKNNFNCNSKMMVYLIEGRVCRKQYKW